MQKEYDKVAAKSDEFRKMLDTYKEHWISVTDELPSAPDGLYLATGECLEKRFTIICRYIADSGWDTTIYNIVAWMPLVPPYEGE